MLVSRPTATGYGSAVAEILNAFHIGRHLDARVCFVKPARPLNHAIFEIESGDVPMLRGWRAGLTRSRWRVSHGLLEAADRMRLTMVRRAKHASRRADASRGRRRTMKRIVGRLSGSWRRHDDPELVRALGAIDFRRAYVEAPIVASLRPAVSRATESAARRLGIDVDAPIVTVHVRESGYKLSLNLPERPTDVMRNADITNYGPAFAYLVERGYQVIRVGDRASTPVSCPGVLDLARCAARTEALELWCIQRSRFFIASDSGPYMTALLLGVPTLAVNVTALLGGDPLRAQDRYVLKHVVECETGRELTLAEMLTPEYLINFRVPDRYRYVQNSPEEILAATMEMHQALQVDRPPSEAQCRFDRLLRRLASGEAVGDWRRSAGLAPAIYVGRGRVADSFARVEFTGEPDERHG